VYQVNFRPPTTDNFVVADKISEGATFPTHNGYPVDYIGDPYNNPDYKEAGITITRGYNNQYLRQEIYIGKYAGNGEPDWENRPKFSEAAFYVNYGRTPDGRRLGHPISFKTFPEMTKTEDCVIRINWDLNFHL
jgi:hypothetical protein